jgi:hypothetical protein
MRYRSSKLIAVCWGVVATASIGQAADVPPKAALAPVALSDRWSAVFASEARFYSWRSSRGSPTSINDSPGRGSQVYVPYALQLVGSPNDSFKVELLGRGGWVHAKQTTFGVSGDVATITDTVASGTVTYLGSPGIQPFLSLNLNIPTGKAALFGSSANARMDPDLVEIGSYGEGWNVGPSVGFNHPISSSLVLTVAAGQTWRGAFERESSLVALPVSELVGNERVPQQPARLDPGDIFTVTASLSYASGPWSASVQGLLSEETTTIEDGVALYKGGRRYYANAVLGYQWPGSWGATTFTASFSHSNRNDVRFLGASQLATEPFNTNSNLYRVGIQHLWSVGHALWLGPAGSYLTRDRNTYDAGTLQFVPAKERYAAGLLMQAVATQAVSFTLRAEHIWTREGERPAADGQMFSVLANGWVLGAAVPVVSSTGWQIAGGFSARF